MGSQLVPALQILQLTDTADPCMFCHFPGGGVPGATISSEMPDLPFPQLASPGLPGGMQVFLSQPTDIPEDLL